MAAATRQGRESLAAPARLLATCDSLYGAKRGAAGWPTRRPAAAHSHTWIRALHLTLRAARAQAAMARSTATCLAERVQGAGEAVRSAQVGGALMRVGDHRALRRQDGPGRSRGSRGREDLPMATEPITPQHIPARAAVSSLLWKCAPGAPFAQPSLCPPGVLDYFT